ncbi:hypothetical protein I2F27_01565 [Acinetobacter sp. B5B]|uniref:hypothetical protein n=1 Tax=Acinetobacter baretiae TaxID=2605383 RepID=UPI0018C27B66|nr:hypothetical protein [Acinetobacter baretiae]MBF7682026.1 hypothetical protein [Acinetobacter baretiae]
MAKLKKISFLCLSLMTIACHQKQSTTDNLQVDKDPYGQPYYTGNLDGIKMKLGSEMEYIDYEICPIEEKNSKCKPRPERTYDSRFSKFTFTLYYPTDLLLVNYRDDPINHSTKKYDTEKYDTNNQWVDVSVAFNKYVQAGYLKDILHNQTKEPLGKYDYVNTYVKTSEHIYGLQKYKPHPRWSESYGSKNTQDLYVGYNDKGDVSTLIICRIWSPYFNARRCNQQFILSEDTHVNIDASYQTVHLKDWQTIQSKVLQQINYLKVL